MDFQELIAHIKKECEDNFEVMKPYKEFAEDGFDDEVTGSCTKVYREGGVDRGSKWARVYHYVKHDIYIRADGYYSSYDGVDIDGWESFYEVKPKQVVVTQFKSI